MIGVNKSLSLRQAVITVLTVLLVGLFISLYQIVSDLDDMRIRADTRMQQILGVLHSSATRAAYTLDLKLSQQVVEGLFNYAPVIETELLDNFGEQLARLQRPPVQGTLRGLSELLLGEESHYQEELLDPASGESVGSISVTTDNYVMAAGFLRRAATTMLAGIVRSLIIGVVLTLLFYFTLTKPLLLPIKSLSTIDPTSPADARVDLPPGHEEDELGLLANTTNRVLDEFRSKIHEVEAAHQELTRLRNLLSNVINSMPSVLVGVDVEGHVLQWNREAEKSTGIKAKDAEGRLLGDIYPLMAAEMERVISAIRNRSPQPERRISEQIDGQIHYSDVVVYPLVTNGVEGAVIRVDDVTRQVQIEELMIQTEKMSSVGGLAAGMAHEINNPLAGILQNLQVIEGRLSQQITRNVEAAERAGTSMQAIQAYMQEREIFSMIASVMESGRRAARIVENMLSFSRKSSSAFATHDIADLMDRSLELAANDYDLKKKYDFRQIEIERHYAADLPALPCDPGQIQQVFLNILKNGAHAMAVRPPDDQRRSRFTLTLSAGSDQLTIVIGDNGQGIDEAVRKRILEPFFTTKGVGTGTGLGLSVSYFIITQIHHGSLRVASTPGEGATFTIRLPLERGGQTSS